MSSPAGRAFTVHQIRRLEPRVRDLVNGLLGPLASGATPELMASVAEPLPIQVIAELIGVPKERWPWVTRTSTTLRQVVDPFVVFDPAAIDATCGELLGYYGELADLRAATPQDDLLLSLVAAEADGQLNRAELVSLVAILLLAGHEATAGAIGNAVVALGRHPDQRDLLRERPDLWPNAVEELLRYDTVLQTDPRTALEDVTIAGKTIRACQNLTVMLGAANRDPIRFDQPYQLHVDRTDPSPISFGYGIHHCLGAALARLELRIALPAILDALGSYEIDEASIAWKTSLAFRSPTHLCVSRQHL